MSRFEWRWEPRPLVASSLAARSSPGGHRYRSPGDATRLLRREEHHHRGDLCRGRPTRWIGLWHRVAGRALLPFQSRGGGDVHDSAPPACAHRPQAGRRGGHDRRHLLILVRAVRRDVAAAGIGRRVSADEVGDDVEATPRAKHLFDEGLHPRTIAWIDDAHENARIIGLTGQVTKRVAERGALGLVSDGYRDVRALLEIGAKHRRADVSSRARKYYGALREIEHRG